MSNDFNPGKISLVSNADLSSSQYLVAEIVSGSEADAATASTDDIIGVIYDGGDASGDNVSVAISGVAKVKAGGTISEGDQVTADSASKAVATTTTSARILGTALDSAVTGDIFTVLINLYTHP